MFRHFLIVALAAGAAACASASGRDKTAKVDPPLTPTTQFAVTLTHTPDEILLAPHTTGLSAAQAAAVSDLVDRWRDSGGGPVTIQTPSGGGAAAYTGATAVRGALQSLGVDETEVRLVSYQPAVGTTGVIPIVVGFTRYEAHGPKCGREIKDFTKTFSNQPNNNFGCAVTANFAALIANPADLANPRHEDPSDANRRETILGKYRKGEQTSSTKDAQANGAVFSVLQ
jgi:pilus assembly protein CpaD